MFFLLFGRAGSSLQHTGSSLRCSGFSSCGTLAWLPWAMWDISSPVRDWTHVPCIGRQILNHWTTKKVLTVGINFKLYCGQALAHLSYFSCWPFSYFSLSSLHVGAIHTPVINFPLLLQSVHTYHFPFTSSSFLSSFIPVILTSVWK